MILRPVSPYTRLLGRLCPPLKPALTLAEVPPTWPRITEGPFAGYLRNGYRVILMDPAWTYATFSENGRERSPDRHYGCLSLREIAELPIPDLLAPDAVVFMWIIDTHLPQGLELIAEWKLKYKTVGFYFEKTNRDGTDFTGMGFWSRANPEQCWLLEDLYPTQCLFATQGRPQRDSKKVKRLIRSLRREHSRKPDEAAERIEQLVDGPYLEMFCRSGRPGWHTWGNEVGKFTS